MNIRELMIRDWVEFDNQPVQVNSILPGDYIGFKGSGFNDSARPITSFCGLRITGEILKDNGFLFLPKGARHPLHDRVFAAVDTYMSIVPGYTICLYNSWNLDIAGTNPNSLFIKLNYVHELRHALRLVGLNELADNFKIK